jgi:c-di-GMP-binding flagellar brake protein YcgR
MNTDGRQYPRFAVDLPLEIRTQDEMVYHATVCNLSLGGIEFSCDNVTAGDVLPPGHQAFPGQPIAVRVRFGLAEPGADGEVLDIHGEIVVSRRLSQNEYRVGMRFSGFEANGQEILERYFRDRTP